MSYSPEVEYWAPTFVPKVMNGDVLEVMLDALVRLDLLFFHAVPNAPRLYQSGVVYKREPPGQEQWLSWPVMIERGNGDCEDLACWRVAEHAWFTKTPVSYARPATQLVPGKCYPVWSRKENYHGGYLYHIRAWLGNGTIEDPSARLGM